MNRFTKSGLISFLIGMLSASVAAVLMNLSFGLDVAINSFVVVLPRSIIVAGLPSLILAAIVIAVWEKSGKSEKSVIWIGIIVGLVVGLLSSILLSYGWQ